MQNKRDTLIFYFLPFCPTHHITSVIMPKGVALSLQFRILIYRRVQAGFSARQIFDLVFGSEDLIISYRHLKLLHSRLLHDEDFSRFYTCGPLKKTGRNTIMSVAEKNILVACVALNSTRILQIMKRDFIALYHGNVGENPYSLSTFNREMHRANLSVKIIERRNIQCNDFDGLRFLDRVAHIDVADLIFGDEMSSDPKSFQKKKGWAPIGEECRRYQINIGTRTFSTVAMVGMLGFIAWEIFEGNSCR